MSSGSYFTRRGAGGAGAGRAPPARLRVTYGLHYPLVLSTALGYGTRYGFTVLANPSPTRAPRAPSEPPPQPPVSVCVCVDIRIYRRTTHMTDTVSKHATTTKYELSHSVTQTTQERREGTGAPDSIIRC